MKKRIKNKHAAWLKEWHALAVPELRRSHSTCNHRHSLLMLSRGKYKGQSTIYKVKASRAAGAGNFSNRQS